MRPITANDPNYFWIGSGTPTVTNGVPEGATYKDVTGGNNWEFRSGAWVDILDESVNSLKLSLNIPKIYRALLTQASTAAPVATVLENMLSAAVVWARSAKGTYTATLASAFTANLTFPRCDMNSNSLAATSPVGHALVRTSANVLTLTTYDLGTLDVNDGLLVAVPFEILVYPSAQTSPPPDA